MYLYVLLVDFFVGRKVQKTRETCMHRWPLSLMVATSCTYTIFVGYRENSRSCSFMHRSSSSIRNVPLDTYEYKFIIFLRKGRKLERKGKQTKFKSSKHETVNQQTPSSLNSRRRVLPLGKNPIDGCRKAINRNRSRIHIHIQTGCKQNRERGAERQHPRHIGYTHDLPRTSHQCAEHHETLP